MINNDNDKLLSAASEQATASADGPAKNNAVHDEVAIQIQQLQIDSKNAVTQDTVSRALAALEGSSGADEDGQTTESETPIGIQTAGGQHTQARYTTTLERLQKSIANDEEAEASRNGGNKSLNSRYTDGPIVLDYCPCGHTPESGNLIVLWGLGYGGGIFPSTCVLGPNWICMLITYALIVGISSAWLVLVASRNTTSDGLFIAGVISTFVLTTLFSITALSDPGVKRRRTKRELEQELIANNGEGPTGDFTLCSRCNIFREPGVAHCYLCNVCVETLDHHCPWTGKCIGKRTIRFFYAFLIYLAIHMVFMIVVVVQ